MPTGRWNYTVPGIREFIGCNRSGHDFQADNGCSKAPSPMEEDETDCLTNCSKGWLSFPNPHPHPHILTCKCNEKSLCPSAKIQW